MVNADKLQKLDEPPPVGTDEDYRCIEQAAGIETPKSSRSPLFHHHEPERAKQGAVGLGSS